MVVVMLHILRCDMLYDMNVTMIITFVKAVIIVTKVMTICMTITIRTITAMMMMM